MYWKFQELPMWMSRRKANRWMAASCFRKWCPSTRCNINGTEVFIEKHSSLIRQYATWSNYKNHNILSCPILTYPILSYPIRILSYNQNTFKVLLSISPDCRISNLFQGSIFDVDLVEQCGLLPKLQRVGNQHLLTAYGVTPKHATIQIGGTTVHLKRGDKNGAHRR